MKTLTDKDEHERYEGTDESSTFFRRALAPLDPQWLARYVKSAKCMGFSVNPGSVEDYVSLVSAAIRDEVRCRILTHNLHSLHEFFRSSGLRRCYRDRVVLVDGMPIIGLLKLAGFSVGRDDRVTYVDFIWPLLERARDEGWRVFVVGQTPDVLEAALAEIRRRLPGIAIDGRDGFFDKTTGSAESLGLVERINRFGADLLLVGMGTPLQEHWIHDHETLLDVPAILTCGACMEYVAGKVRTPPRWMGRAGLEWAFRLMENPRRFAYRYLVEPWGLAIRLARHYLAEQKS